MSLDLAQVDTQSAHLDLLIEAAEVFDPAVVKPARAVTALVDVFDLAIDHARYETLGDPPRTIRIHSINPDTADAHLPDNADRHLLAMAIDDMEAHIVRVSVRQDHLTGEPL
ncbi:MAG: hypothetical protein ACREPE_06475, partial [Lysobacter sp.]